MSLNPLPSKLTVAASVVALSGVFSPAVAAIPEAQQAALRAIFIEAEGASWPADRQTGWSADAAVSCEAEAITCDANDNVTGLALVSLPKSAGKLSSRVSELVYLEELNLAATGMSADLPSSMTSLGSLRTLVVDGDTYSGTIPDWFGDFPALEKLQITATTFDGPMPSSIAQLSTLKYLLVAANDNLNGPIPAALGNLSQLEKLELIANQFQGEIPESLGNLQNLNSLELDRNLLTGDVPAGLYNNPQLDFDLQSPNKNVSLEGNALFTTDPAQLAHPVATQLTAEWQAHDAKIVGLSYLGGDKLSVSWLVHDWNKDVAVPRDLHARNKIDNGYSIYARVPGAAWQHLTSLEGSLVTEWQGSVAGLSASQNVEVQVRRDIGWTDPSTWSTTRELAQSSGEQAGATLLDVSQAANNPPSFTAQGDVLNLSPASAIEIPGWASNLSDNDGNTQGLRFELKYLSNASLFDGVPHISVPSGTLRFNTADQAAGESLVVFELCDTARNQSAAACSEQVLFKVGVDNAAMELPSFQLSVNKSTDSSELQEHVGWASGMQVPSGGNNWAFHTLWVSQSDLFEQDPWISSPSGSLRYQFKAGVRGSSTVYVAIEDKNTGRMSAIQAFELNKTISAGAQADAAANNSANNNAANNGADADNNGKDSTGKGGGGSLGFALLGLGLTGFSRKRK